MVIWGGSEEPHMSVKDFDTDKYKCIAFGFKPDGSIVGAFMSKSANPPHFRVMDGASEMFYTHRDEAIAYVKSHTQAKSVNSKRRKK